MAEPISAFAVYAKKRKTLENTGIAKKQKKANPEIKRKEERLEETFTSNTAKNKSKRSALNGYNSIDSKENILLKAKVSNENKNKSNSKKDKSKATSRKENDPKRNKSIDLGKKLGRSEEDLQDDEFEKGFASSPDAKFKKIELITSKGNLKIDQFDFQRLSVSRNLAKTNPKEEARKTLDWMISPLEVEDFMKKDWERNPVHIKRGKPNYYKTLMSTSLLDKILRKYVIQFTKNIDITSYTNGVRETHNPIGRAFPTVVWDYFMNGCSVRMINPQTFVPKLHALNATLQEYFGCFVGANSYLTPPNSQGFAPHYDDIEAFILQIEGKKRWRLYKPRSENEFLPRYSSNNFTESEIGKPILDTVVNAGDLLYFPRGTIHQGETIDDCHSLHITLSVYQKNSWGDFIEKLMPQVLKNCIENNSEFREGLPLNYLDHIGLVHSEKDSSTRRSFSQKLNKLLKTLIKNVDIDKAADEMAVNHIHDFLPPVVSEAEKECSVLEDGEMMIHNGTVVNRVEIEPDTKVRLLREHCIRLVEEENTYKIYYSTENSKEYHEYALQYLEIDPELVPAVKEIILQYPNFIRVEDLPIEGEDNKIQIVKDLWEKLLVVTEEPLPIID